MEEEHERAAAQVSSHVADVHRSRCWVDDAWRSPTGDVGLPHLWLGLGLGLALGLGLGLGVGMVHVESGSGFRFGSQIYVKVLVDAESSIHLLQLRKRFRPGRLRGAPGLGDSVLRWRS